MSIVGGHHVLPVVKESEIGLIPCPHPKPVKDREITRKPNGEGWEDDVKGHCESKLQPCQYFCAETVQHEYSLSYLHLICGA